MTDFKQCAMKQAEKSVVECRYGAIMVFRNRIIGKGYNTFHYDRISGKNKQCLIHP
jgi:deoxycytidylate deaminase